MAWTFNRDYNDLSQVAQFWEAYNERFEELRAAGKYPYNAEFFNLPGIAEAEKPETPVYLLQKLRRVVEGHDAIARDVAAGCSVVERVTEPPTRGAAEAQAHARSSSAGERARSGICLARPGRMAREGAHASLTRCSSGRE